MITSRFKIALFSSNIRDVNFSNSEFFFTFLSFLKSFDLSAILIENLDKK